MEVCIRTRLAGTKRSEQIKLIDWTNRSDRKWFESHQHWAMSNGHEITFSPANGYHREIHRQASEGKFGDAITA